MTKIQSHVSNSHSTRPDYLHQGGYVTYALAELCDLLSAILLVFILHHLRLELTTCYQQHIVIMLSYTGMCFWLAGILKFFHKVIRN